MATDVAPLAGDMLLTVGGVVSRPDAYVAWYAPLVGWEERIIDPLNRLRRIGDWTAILLDACQRADCRGHRHHCLQAIGTLRQR